MEDGHTAEAKEMFPLETAAPPQAPYTSWRPESRLGFSAADEARSQPEVGSRLIPGPGPSLPQLSSEPEQVLSQDNITKRTYAKISQSRRRAFSWLKAATTTFTLKNLKPVC